MLPIRLHDDHLPHRSARTALVLGCIIAPALGVTPALAEPSSTPPATPSDANHASESFLPVEPAQRGFQLGLGAGVSFPLGDADGGSNVNGIAWRSGELAGIVQHRVPISVEAGYRIDPNWWVGALPELSFGNYGDECVGPDDACDFTDFRVLAGATWYPLGFNSLSPWLRLALGYEWLRATLVLEDGFSGSETLGGPLAQLQLGMDWLVGETVAFGPYVSAAVGSYLSSSFTCQPAVCPAGSSTEGRSAHGWVSIGLRATHGP